ncbi:MAG: VCBS repeat-containing protein [Planctomycetes bacterium]|nr:VCBS repeat-containing protein [Planctomycetota bacterium]
MTMSIPVLALLASAMAPAPQGGDGATPKPLFHAPVMLRAGGEAVRVESPGYAAPCWADVDGDGDQDLLVGQFAGGRIHVYENDGDGELAAGRWLEADGDVAAVPGVW